MEPGCKANATTRAWIAWVLLTALGGSSLTGCSLTGSRTRWHPPPASPAVDVSADGYLAAAHAQFAAGRAAEAACDPVSIDHYFAASAAAWPYHAAGAMTPGDPGTELYRASVRQLIASAVRFGRLHQQQGITLCSGQIVPIAYRGFLWRPDEFHAFIPVGSYSSPRIACRYASCGVGVEFVILASDPARRPFLAGSQPFAATAVLKPGGGEFGSGFALEFYDPLHTATTDTGLPLARDLTAPLAYGATQEGDSWLEGFLQPDTDPAAEGLRMSQPFQPGKIPVVLVHGLASSPVTWSNLENDLRAQPAIMARYQFWYFRYDTGDPFLSSASLMRRQLAELRATYDPARVDASLSRMVLVGHSLGGLISKLQITYSGEEVWNSAANVPFNTIQTDPQTRADLARSFFFTPSPDVSRVVFIATPHRGSVYATRCIGRVSSSLVEERPAWKARHAQLVRDNPCAFREELERGIPTSVDLLEPSSCILGSTARIPIRPGVRMNSIIGDDRWTCSEGRSDGVVAVSSARLLNVESEEFVDASHTQIQQRPETSREVLRILLAHAAEMPATMLPYGCLSETVSAGSGPFDQAQQHDQHDGADGGRDERAEQTARRDAKQAEQPAAEQRADHADDQVADDPEPAAFGKLSRQPTGHQPDEQKPDKSIHRTPPE
jgi:pimeloyl-ACP methyl ester carboxylesterase